MLYMNILLEKKYIRSRPCWQKTGVGLTEFYRAAV